MVVCEGGYYYVRGGSKFLGKSLSAMGWVYSHFQTFFNSRTYYPISLPHHR